MALSSTLLLPCFCLVLGIILVLLPPHKQGFLRGKKFSMPPGPPAYPVVGTLLPWLRARNGGTMVPWVGSYPALQENEIHTNVLVVQLLSQSSNEMTTLHMGPKTWVLLNTSRVVNEIIAKRASITNERPYFPIASGLVSKDKRVFLHKTKDWRQSRRLLHQLLMGPGSKIHQQVVEAASCGLLKAYLDEPEAWYMHNYRFPVSIIYKLVTGLDLDKTTPQLEELQNVTSTFLTSINSSPIDFFSQLSFIVPRPLQPWRRHWKSIGDFHYRVFEDWWKDIKRNVVVQDAGSSFVRDAVLKEPGTEDQAMYLTMLAIVAGADNPRMTMNALVMAALSYPDVMKQARDELDELCGGLDEEEKNTEAALRLPTLDDLPKLPYTAAVVKETLRWRPTVPLVPQRVLTEDMSFEEYNFPAGTEFLVNTFPVCRNGYDDPETFAPERWLDGSTPGGGVEQDLWQFAFSAGRRSCVGYKLAQKELFVFTARLLYCFNFQPVGDVDDTRLNAFAVGEPFPARITVRSASHKQLIYQEASVRARNSEG